MPHEAGMLDTACKCDLIVNGRVNNQSSTASLITHEHYPDCSAWLPLPHAPSGTGQPTETDTAVPPAISIFIQLPIPGVYESSFQVRVKISNPSTTQPLVLSKPHRTEDDLSKTRNRR